MSDSIKATYIGGPTVIVEIEGVRFMADPTLDEGGNDYQMTPEITLHKAEGPSTRELPPIDYVLLSHDTHQDNLDTKGRELLTQVKKVFTSREAAENLQGNSVGMSDWESQTVVAPTGAELQITATPARHGCAGFEKFTGPVVGFVVTVKKQGVEYEIYVTGDTVYYEGVKEVSERFKPQYVFAFAGGVKAADLIYITMNESDLINTAFAFPDATIIPVHYEGWTHYSGSIDPAKQAFAMVGLSDRLKVLGTKGEIVLPIR